MENMENLENQNQEVNNEVNEQQTETTVDNANSVNEGGNGTEQVNQDTNLEEWQKDSRYGKMWNKADDLYNSYKSLETNFQDINPKYKALVKTLKENGFQAENLADELKKYADYRNPESRINQVYNYVDKLLNNELYSNRVIQFFNQLEAEELQRLYPNMSAEQIKKQQELEAQLNQLKSAEQQRQEQQYMTETTNQINNALNDCETMAKEYGFKMTDEVKNYLLTHCRDKNIDPRYIKSEFINLYGKQLREARDKKVLANYNERKEKLKSAQIVSGGAGKVGNIGERVKGRESFLAGLKKIYGRA